MVRGLGRLTGLEVVQVPGATGYFDTNYEGKGRYAVSALNRHDFVWVHVESPDEAGHACRPVGETLLGAMCQPSADQHHDTEIDRRHQRPGRQHPAL